MNIRFGGRQEQADRIRGEKNTLPLHEAVPLSHGREPRGLVAYHIYSISHEKSSNTTCT